MVFTKVFPGEMTLYLWGSNSWGLGEGEEGKQEEEERCFKERKQNQTEQRKQNILLWIKHKLEKRAIKAKEQFFFF